MNSHYPKFTISDVAGEGDNMRLSGKLDKFYVSSETWVDDLYWGYLFDGKPILYGRWHRRKTGWEFAVSEVLYGGSGTFIDQTFDVLDGYWGERAEVVFDESRKWSERNYQDDGEHTHCLICWGTIWKIDNSRYMASNHNDELCLKCHSSYVNTGNLDFIRPFAGFNRKLLTRRALAFLRRKLGY